jgi:peptidoglycan/LPS O-acetylase OafA/YrhL
MLSTSSRTRNHQFDLLRIIFAILVLVTHAVEITSGDRSRDLFVRLTHVDFSFGTLAVDGFFLLSGFLIVKSWQSGGLLSFLKKRFLRIAPGYAATVIVTTIVIGILAPGVTHFFRHIHGEALGGILFIYNPESLPVFPGSAYPVLNGSLWTIIYEFRCYLIVAVFGVLGLFNHRWTWLVTTYLLVMLRLLAPTPLGVHWPHDAYYLLFGSPTRIVELVPVFFVGGCFFLYRQSIPFSPLLGILALTTIVLVDTFRPQVFATAMVIFGGYLLFYFTNRPFQSLSWMRRVPDVSYGVYLYGWPVESFLVFRLHPSPWVTFAASTFICIGLGWGSWKLVEEPALRLGDFKTPKRLRKTNEQPVQN